MKFMAMVGWAILVAISPLLAFFGTLGLASGGPLIPCLTSLVAGIIGLAVAFNWREGK